MTAPRKEQHPRKRKQRNRLQISRKHKLADPNKLHPPVKCFASPKKPDDIIDTDQTPTKSPEELLDTPVDTIMNDETPTETAQVGTEANAATSAEVASAPEDREQISSGENNGKESAQQQTAEVTVPTAAPQTADPQTEQAAADGDGSKAASTAADPQVATTANSAESSTAAPVDGQAAEKADGKVAAATEEAGAPEKQLAQIEDRDDTVSPEKPTAGSENFDDTADETPVLASQAAVKEEESSDATDTSDAEDVSGQAVAAAQAPTEKQMANRSDADVRSAPPAGDDVAPVDNGRTGNRQQENNGQQQDNRGNKDLAASPAANSKDGTAKSASGEATGTGGQTETATAKPAGEQFTLLQKIPLDNLGGKTALSTLNLSMGHQLVVGTHNLAVQEAASAGLQQSGTVLQNSLASAQAAADQVVAAVSRQLSAGKSTFRVQLHPAELGQVDIKMDFAADGKMMTTLTVDNEKTLHLLQRDQHTLGKMLENAGFNMDQGNLNFNLRQQAGNDSGFGGPDRESAMGEDLQAEDDVMPAEIIAVNASDSGLDISV